MKKLGLLILALTSLGPAVTLLLPKLTRNITANPGIIRTKDGRLLPKRRQD